MISLLKSTLAFSYIIIIFSKENFFDYVDITQTSKYYYLVQYSENSDNDPLLFWLCGGPGASSIFDFYNGIGPYIIDQTELKHNPYPLSKFANIIYIDQPAGTGLSQANYNDYRTSMDQVQSDFVIFCTKFFEKYPEFRGKPLILGGNSFAGIYVPKFARNIIDNKIQGANLKGIFFSNGSVDYYLNTQSVGEYVNNHVNRDHFSEEVRLMITQHSEECKQAFQNQRDTKTKLLICEEVFKKLKFKHINRFNYKSQKSFSVPKQLQDMLDKFIQDNHHEYKQYQALNIQVNLKLQHEIVDSSTLKDIEYLLNKEIITQVINGDLDLVVNSYGVELWIRKLQIYSDILNEENIQKSNDKIKYYKFKNFSFIRIPEAGHSPFIETTEINQQLFKMLVDEIMGLEDAKKNNLEQNYPCF